ncbi:unnamed protein product [Prorocentrum cordatum]|uniref:Uncharacterized protein n=1 Tax=Prorocentrum cordatum TaxID=2364126 RepID=A0ABN9WFK6_9DINO|nr:unnamed protein product [Polarella glacialis]
MFCSPWVPGGSLDKVPNGRPSDGEVERVDLPSPVTAPPRTASVGTGSPEPLCQQTASRTTAAPASAAPADRFASGPDASADDSFPEDRCAGGPAAQAHPAAPARRLAAGPSSCGVGGSGGAGHRSRGASLAQSVRGGPPSVLGQHSR